MVRFPSVFPSHAFSYCRNKMCFILSLLFLVIGDGNKQVEVQLSLTLPVMWWRVCFIRSFWCSGSNHLQRVRCRSLQKASQSCSIYVCEHVLCEVFLFSVCFLKLLLRFWWWVWKCTILFSLNGKRKFEQCKITHHSQWESDRIQIHSHWWDWFFFV